MKFIYLLLLSVCFFACQQRTKITGEKDKRDTTAGNIPIEEQTCYTYIKGRDTAQLTLITTGVVSTGELNYKWFEKDRNMGSIEGEMRGDTLVANYTFNSEGKKSVRQVVFLKKGDQFLEGFGEVEEKDGKTQFKDLKRVDFSNPIVFERVACK
ncbi:MAG: hypothetical protein REI64_08100 [Pedobacter sp.]|uniref:hypothetical protein n=1 Tax=Pedobacter sp. TaxID=1411316 RepID=UPI002809C858|nr:hypothetical protein [Pedobacter sp.]MDQ8004744.1 hypothetical protein [Pedobacter sp.]